jgi:serine protease
MGRTALLAIMAAGCAVGGQTNEHLSSTEGESFEEFRDNTYREDFEGGVYIVDGDTPVLDDKALYEHWESQQQGALIVNRVGQSDDKWNDQQKLNLTYCVSDNFGTRKATVVEALRQATEVIGWETMASVNFVYKPDQDANCTAQNGAVVFDVRPVSNQPYLARAFFPGQPRYARNVLVDTSAFQPGWPLANVLGHELGHALGFRHEHTRPEAGTCFEDSEWRPLTPYDSRSIMHYPQCNGGSNSLNWSANDKAGVAMLYGAPGSGGGGTVGPTKTETKSGDVAASAEVRFGPYSVAAGSTFTVTMTGSGAPALYVSWTNAPTTSAYNCRPYLTGAAEECSLTVPAGTTNAHVMVRGYTAASYAIEIKWSSP